MSDEHEELEEKPGLSGASKLLLGVAVVSVCAGGVMYFLSSGDAPSGGATPPLGAGLTAQSGSETALEPDPLRPWSQFFMKGGGGFLLGFSVGYAARQFLKVSALFVGIVLLAIFGLHATGVIEVDFLRLEGMFDRAWEWLTQQFSASRAFLESNLPSGTAATGGALFGFKRG